MHEKKEKYFGIEFPQSNIMSAEEKRRLVKLLFISPTTDVSEVKSIINNQKLTDAIGRLIHTLNCELESVNFDDDAVDNESPSMRIKMLKKKFKAWQKEFGLPSACEISEILAENNIPIKGVWADFYHKCQSQTISSPIDHFEYLSEYIIGQENAVKAISLLMHQQKIKSNEYKQLPKNAVLLIGNTGTGKSYLVNKSHELLGVPMQRINCASLVPAGIVGQTLDKCLTNLYSSNRSSKKRTANAMLHFDEIDKLSTEYHSSDSYKSSIQFELLRFFDRNEKIYFPESHMQFCNLVSIPTNNLMLVFSGAFEGLDQIIYKRIEIERKADLSLIDTGNILQYCTTQDIVDYGFIPELAARMTLISPLNKLDVNSVYNILLMAKESIYVQHLNKCKLLGLNISFTNAALRKIATMVVAQKTGLRGLNSIFNNLLSEFYFDLDKYKHSIIEITENTVDFLLKKQVIQPILHEFEREKNLNKIAEQFNSDIDSILDIYSQWKKLVRNKN